MKQLLFSNIQFPEFREQEEKDYLLITPPNVKRPFDNLMAHIYIDIEKTCSCNLQIAEATWTPFGCATDTIKQWANAYQWLDSKPIDMTNIIDTNIDLQDTHIADCLKYGNEKENNDKESEISINHIMLAHILKYPSVSECLYDMYIKRDKTQFDYQFLTECGINIDKTLCGTPLTLEKIKKYINTHGDNAIKSKINAITIQDIVFTNKEENNYLILHVPVGNGVQTLSNIISTYYYEIQLCQGECICDISFRHETWHNNLHLLTNWAESYEYADTYDKNAWNTKIDLSDSFDEEQTYLLGHLSSTNDKTQIINSLQYLWKWELISNKITLNHDYLMHAVIDIDPSLCSECFQKNEYMTDKNYF